MGHEELNSEAKSLRPPELEQVLLAGNLHPIRKEITPEEYGAIATGVAHAMQNNPSYYCPPENLLDSFSEYIVVGTDLFSEGALVRVLEDPEERRYLSLDIVYSNVTKLDVDLMITSLEEVARYYECEYMQFHTERLGWARLLADKFTIHPFLLLKRSV